MSCRRTRLAANNVVSVERCACSTIHVNLGATSLRLTPDAFERLTSGLCEALGRLGALTCNDGAPALTVSTRGEA